MIENEEVTASDVIDMVVEHLNDVKNLNKAVDSAFHNSMYSEYRNSSYKELQEKLDGYVDQRIKAILIKSNLIKIVDPMD